jgi:hypothetical protein
MQNQIDLLARIVRLGILWTAMQLYEGKSALNGTMQLKRDAL